MGEVLANLFATVITVPALCWIIVFWISIQWTGSRRHAFHLAADITTIFLIFSVYYTAYEIWHLSFLWVILFAVLGSAILFSFLQWRANKELYLSKIVKGMWRFNFLLFAGAYIVLFFYGIVHTLFIT